MNIDDEIIFLEKLYQNNKSEVFLKDIVLTILK